MPGTNKQKQQSETENLKIMMFAVIVTCFFTVASAGMLTPQESESRFIQEMNGMWNFRADKSPQRNQGMVEKWWEQSLAQTGDVIPMPVPSSYNDITTDRSLQYFVGWVWYDREFYVNHAMQDMRLVLRIDSAHYYSMVWINGNHLMDHDGGHLPFESEVNDYVTIGGVNRVTVAVNNTLGPHTLPPGSISHKSGPTYPPGYFVQNLQFDFFNYAGIHRRVRLYATPKLYVDDITIVTNFSESAHTGSVDYKVVAGPAGSSGSVSVEVVDMTDKTVASDSQMNGKLTIPKVQLWWPYSMSGTNFTYMYTLKVTLTGNNGEKDIYRQKFGVRTVSVTKTQLLINNQPFYCHGVDKHEDSNIRGKGLDFALIARDFNMLKWLGVNCFRTSHYPYAEEIMDEADRWGIAVIDECPGVGISEDANFQNESLTHHLEVMKELVTRDKNRPSAIMWSVANEPASAKDVAHDYFKTVINYTRSLDSTRLVTFVSSADYFNDKAAEFTDIQCFNRYYGWYEDTGHLETIPYKMAYDLEKWYEKLQKPLLVSEYGAGTVAGLHTMPSFVFTEDYQKELLTQYHPVYDVYKKKFLVGELVWNFADFMTDEAVTRVVGNKKGLLTRERQPKMGAYEIRRRYWSLINHQQSVKSDVHNDNPNLVKPVVYSDKKDWEDSANGVFKMMKKFDIL